MSAAAAPSRLEPHFLEKIWGVCRLEPLFPGAEPRAEPVGEVWLTAEDCLLATGPFAGRRLGDAWREMPLEWKGSESEAGFPLLVKFIFPAQKLSVQVHPGDAYAAAHEIEAGGRGKTEMWHVVAAEAGAEVRIGLEPGEDASSLREAIATGTIENRIRRMPIRSGDTLFIPAGTVHTIGPGSILCEIQEYSDLTYRLYDYGRLGADGKPRALHIEKAFDVIRFSPSPAGLTYPLVQQRGPLTVRYLAACPYFATERWEFAGPIEAASDVSHFDLLVFLAGAGRLVAGGDSQQYRGGEAWFLPATLGEYRLEPAQASVALRTYVPGLDALESRLREQGFSCEDCTRTIFR
jgi:mannose-6-phosphate isomerase